MKSDWIYWVSVAVGVAVGFFINEYIHVSKQPTIAQLEEQYELEKVDRKLKLLKDKLWDYKTDCTDKFFDEAFKEIKARKFVIDSIGFEREYKK